MSEIKHSEPFVGQEEAEVASRYLMRKLLSTGKIVEKFERELTKLIGVRFACALSSGTSALFLLLRELPAVFPELRGKSEVIIPSFSCFALSNAVLMNDLEPVFADIDDRTYSLDPRDIAKRITKRTMCVVFVHALGICSDLREIQRLGIPVIEDIAQAFGGRVDGRYVGSFGVASFSSFFATKVITTAGEGGAVLSNERSLVERIKDVAEYDKKIYDTRKIRFNFKMTDINAAVGLVQLKKLKNILRIRKKIAHVYFEMLSELEKERLIRFPPKENNIFFRFPIFIERGDQKKVIKFLQKNGVMAQKPIFRPLHYDIRPRERLPKTEIAYSKTVSIPIHPNMTEKDATRVSGALVHVLKQT